ncbi:NUDIX domain-containing protein [Streptomyces caniscabiei]|uniref:NUDIX hydrolase n=1 Tax=Streptomyces caniscabiei TaxID=2746961 RepID=UPI0029B6B303|nr:NUDIX domain-containing protein [Streptomyces caniscabiei]MDX2776614.1 NUDIX domain-containing protein [Streptomyces caniscabiei]
MIIPVVNEKDENIGYKERADIDPATDIVRSASLWITNPNGDILLAQRKFTKRSNPGKWSEAVGGTVEGDDDYESTMLREAEEEIGISVTKYAIGPKQYVDSPTKYFVQWYTTVIDAPIEAFKVQEEELEQLAWISEAQFVKELKDTPEKYIDEMQDIARLFL